ncbi:MAG: hypothetical protein RIB57_16130 [Pelagibacterium sp.]|uniref:hypothetical protein n=1 Tax=Pelagibacterium sp. TaxID=1967288 RepID=UPI0032EBB63A
MKHFLAPIALASTLALAGCGGGEEADAAATAAPETPAVEAPAEPVETTPAPAAEEAEAPAVTEEPTEDEAAAEPAAGGLDPMQMLSPEAQEALQSELADMTDEEKQQAVDEARSAAEAAAREQGLSDELIQQVGDQAEAAARTMFGLE